MTGARAAVPSREELRTHLLASGLAGEVQTSRQNNLGNIGRLLDRHDNYTFGLQLGRAWTAAEVLALLADRVGISPDPEHRTGVDTIDPDRTLDALDAMAGRLRAAAAERADVLLATGHPSGVLAVHLRVAAALAAAGCRLLTPAEGHSWRWVTDGVPQYREIRYLGGVAMASDRGELKHTHSPAPMTAILAALAAAGEPPPDLVVADHGWAGAAGQAGVPAVGFADCNDPALFVGEAEGKVAVAVPIDDNVLPLRYEPVAAYLVAAITRHSGH